MIEVKACSEWIKTRPEHCKRAHRRRGRFKFHGYEHADFFLFVVVLESGELLLRLVDAAEIEKTVGVKSAVVWPLVFAGTA